MGMGGLLSLVLSAVAVLLLLRYEYYELLFLSPLYL